MMNTYRFRQQATNRTVVVQADLYSIAVAKAVESLSEMTGVGVMPGELVWLDARVEEDDEAETIECPACGEIEYVWDATCRRCGYPDKDPT